MKVKPLAVAFGGETADVDLSAPLSREAFAELEAAFFAAQLLVLRGQSITPAQYLAFACRFGPPEPHVIDQFHHPVDPNILILSNRTEHGRPLGLADAGSYYHTDYSYLQVPARATMLYSIEVPKVGGNTLFANQYAAYDGLSDTMKRRVAKLVGVHHYGNRKVADEMCRTAASPLTDAQKAKLPLISHPIVRAHPVTGRKALYAVSGRSYGIVGMPQDEALALLDELATHATQPMFLLEYAHRPGDVVIWDNASLLHSETLTDPAYPRTLWRITIKEPSTKLDARAVLAPTYASGALQTHSFAIPRVRGKLWQAT
jgi:taurine dioxygenase